MKKSLFTLLFFALLTGMAVAQVPQAFKYQAVIRDLSGRAISDRDVNLKITLLAGSPDGVAVYSETHPVTTNSLGLVNLEIGRGLFPSSEFALINWSGGNYYVMIEMDQDGGQSFRPIGVSQLLAVPFALHSASANELTGFPGTGLEDGIPAMQWSLFGNRGSNPPVDKLGTTDAADLVVVTNNVQRMLIKADGDIDIARSLSVGENLTVKQNVTLNTLGGETENMGPFTVSEYSPTLLSGILTVDGATDLNSSLNVDGITHLNSDFNVNRMSPSMLSGTLLVKKDATFNEHVKLDNADLDSDSPYTGALTIAGGIGIGKNMYVGGNAFFSGPLNVTNTDESTSNTTGALIVAGGTGIGKRLNVGGNVKFDKELLVSGKTTINNNLFANGQVTFKSTPSGTGYASYPLRIEGSAQGIAVKVSADNPSKTNKFITFFSNTGTVVGRIEGQTLDNLKADPEYKMELGFKSADVAFSIMDLGIGIVETVIAGGELASALSSTTACVGLGACATVPIPSLIIDAGIELGLKIADLVLQTGEVVKNTAELALFIDTKHNSVGVSYQSGSADYAEWLLKENPADTYLPGELVGIKNGVVTRNVFGSDKVMVVSTNPIVLGNMPAEGQEHRYVRIAFMGQVPVKVIGTVKPGDYILPNELGNGFGKAVSPDKMKVRDYKHIVGVAWNDIQTIANGLNLVNVAVGINANDLVNAVYQQEERINQLKAEYQQLQLKNEKSDQVLARLVPGYAEAIGYNGETSDKVTSVTPSVVNAGGQKFTAADFAPQSAEDIVYFELERDQVEGMLELARDTYREASSDHKLLTLMMPANAERMADGMPEIKMPAVEEHPFWKRIDEEPAYRQAVVDLMKDNLEKSLYTQRKNMDKFTNLKVKN